MAVTDLMIRIGAQVSPQFAGAVKNATSMLSGMVGMLGIGSVGAMAGLAVSSAVRGLKGVESAKDFAETMGISISRANKLRQVADATGSSLGALGRGISTVATEASKNPETFRAMGLNPSGGDPVALFGEVMNKINAEENATNRVAMAKKLLGKQWMELLNFANDYNDEMARSVNISDEFAKTAEQANKDWSKTFDSIDQRMAKLLGPSYAKLGAAMQLITNENTRFTIPGLVSDGRTTGQALTSVGKQAGIGLATGGISSGIVNAFTTAFAPRPIVGSDVNMDTLISGALEGKKPAAESAQVLEIERRRDQQKSAKLLANYRIVGGS